MKYTTQANGGKANYPKVDLGRTPNINTGSDEQAGMRVDPSVGLGELRGEPPGSVPLARTMQKPTAYKAKKGAP